MKNTNYKEELRGDTLTLSYNFKDASFGTLRNNTSDVLHISFTEEFAHLPGFSVMPKQTKCFSSMFSGTSYIKAFKLGCYKTEIRNPVLPDYDQMIENLFGFVKETNNEQI